MRKERVLIGILVVALVWFGATIVRLENYHYAVQVGVCSEHQGVENLIKRDECLNKTESRTNAIWHLLYGLKIL